MEEQKRSEFVQSRRLNITLERRVVYCIQPKPLTKTAAALQARDRFY